MNNDAEQLRSIASRIVQELSADIPWHVNAYYPAYEFNAPPTPAATLARAQQIGREAGLDFVYLGNVEDTGSNTYCPSCNTLLVERAGLALLRSRLLQSGACPKCAKVVPGIAWDWASKLRGHST